MMKPFCMLLVCILFMSACNLKSNTDDAVNKTAEVAIEKQKANPYNSKSILYKDTPTLLTELKTFDKNTSFTEIDNSIELRSRNSNPFSSAQTGAIFLIIEKNVESAVRGKEIEILVEAKSDSPNQLDIAYSTNMNGNSGWLTLPLSEDFEVHKVRYSVPPTTDEKLNNDYLGLNPVSNGLENVAHIRSISINIVE